jgi:hypothetical protein
VDNVVKKRSVSSQRQLKVFHHFSVYLFMPYDDPYGSKQVAFYMVHKKIVGLFKIVLLFIVHGTASIGKYKTKAYRGNRDIAPLILTFGTRWRSVAGLNPWPLYTPAKSDRYLLNWRLGRPEGQSGRFGKEEEIIRFLLFLRLLFLYFTFVANLLLAYSSYITFKFTHNTSCTTCVHVDDVECLRSF